MVDSTIGLHAARHTDGDTTVGLRSTAKKPRQHYQLIPVKSPILSLLLPSPPPPLGRQRAASEQVSVVGGYAVPLRFEHVSLQKKIKEKV